MNIEMCLFTVFIFSIIVFTIIIYYLKTESSKRLKFESISTLLQTLFIFVTLWIAVYTIQSGNSDTKELFKSLNSFNTQFFTMSKSLDDVSNKLKEMPDKIESFSKAISSLNDVVTQQKIDFIKNTESLNKTIQELSISVSDYEKNIINYSSQLKSIVDQTDKQLVIWKDQQRVLLDEFSRKPKLLIEPKEIKKTGDTCVINDIIIKNDGNIEANIRVIFLFIRIDQLYTLKSTCFEKYRPYIDENVMSYRFLPLESNIDIISAGSSIIIPCEIKMNNKLKSVSYRIDFFSKYYSDIIVKNMIIK